jgi:hypothetical protein
MKARRRILLGSVLLSIIGAAIFHRFPGGNEKTPPAHVSEVTFDADCPIDYSYNPGLVMSEKIQSEPEYTRYRMSWVFTAAGYVSAGTAVYDKKNQVLHEENRVSDPSRQSAGAWHYEYRNVTDATLHRFAKDLPEKGGGPFSFNGLTAYGCSIKVRELPMKPTEALGQAL